VGSFPGIGYAAGQASPAAVGIVMASGDRNNPIDETAGYPQGTPAKFRLTVVFDRQDTAAWSSNLPKIGNSYVITDGWLEPSGYPNSFSSTAGGIPGTSQGDPVITPGNAAYYLAPTLANGTPDTAHTKFGYFINFPSPTVNANPPPANFIPKALTDPYVVSGSPFYSYFAPTNADPCSGGNGYTYTDILCSALNPSLSAAGSSCVTGNALPFSYWSGVPSNFSVYGTKGVFQGGTVAIVNPPAGSPSTQVNFATLLASPNNAYPKIRVWRTVH
jgi:hypothetical protein